MVGTKVTDKSGVKILSYFCQYTWLETLNLESNTGIGFKTASFMLKVISYSRQSKNDKLYLWDLRLDYTNVSNGLKKWLREEMLSIDLGMSLNAS